MGVATPSIQKHGSLVQFCFSSIHDDTTSLELTMDTILNTINARTGPKPIRI